MGLFWQFTKNIFGKYGKVEDGPEIIDGKIITPYPKPEIIQDETGETGIDMEPPNANILDRYIEEMISNGKAERTAKEYCYDIKSFSDPEQIDHITVERIKEVVSKVSVYTARRKLSALQSFAKWRVASGVNHLYLTLALIDVGSIFKEMNK